MSVVNEQVKTKTAPWVDELVAIQKIGSKEQIKRLTDWRRRFDIYDGEDIKHTLIQPLVWQNNRHLKKAAEKLMVAIHALDELSQHENKENAKEIRNVTHMRAAINKVIDIHITQLEIEQFKLLSKSLYLKRHHEILDKKEVTQSPLKEKRDELNKNHENTKKQIEKHRGDYLAEADRVKLPNTFRFFHERDSHWDIESHIDRTKKVATAINLFNSYIAESARHVINAVTRIVTAFPALSSLLNFTNGFIQSIPLISSIISAIPIGLRAIRTWQKSQSPVKRGLAIFSFTLILIGFAVSGLGPLAAGLTMIGLIALGGITTKLIPLIKIQRAVYQCNRELLEIKESRETLTKPNPTKILNPRDRHYLLLELERALLRDIIQYDEFSALKKAVLNDDYETLKLNTRLISIFNPPHDSLAKFLLVKLGEREKDLQADLAKLKPKAISAWIAGINTMITLLAVILLPFVPPAGVALLTLSSLVGISRSYEVPESTTMKWVMAAALVTVIATCVAILLSPGAPFVLSIGAAVTAGYIVAASINAAFDISGKLNRLFKSERAIGNSTLDVAEKLHIPVEEAPHPSLVSSPANNAIIIAAPSTPAPQPANLLQEAAQPANQDTDESGEKRQPPH